MENAHCKESADIRKDRNKYFSNNVGHCSAADFKIWIHEKKVSSMLFSVNLKSELRAKV